ncbi:uncharacterized protein LOC34623637 [Cyclospora cayetanensis]|uniref:Uncharacterized protein LOC34623637 n=1 Tax=Cyclospora cayetanensis TaxID=88456 RepID=A0A6P6RXU1_9EIME|nr:uncharacterized protein LOC34623637 [Cyclospora cayetanensis]
MWALTESGLEIQQDCDTSSSSSDSENEDAEKGMCRGVVPALEEVSCACPLSSSAASIGNNSAASSLVAVADGILAYKGLGVSQLDAAWRLEPREYCVIIDERTKCLSIVPSGRLTFFLQESPAQRAQDFFALQREEMQRGADCLRMALHAKSLAVRTLLEANCHLSPQQLKHTQQARLQLQQTGSWEGAAFAARGVPVTEVQLAVSRQLARGASRPITNKADFENFFAKAPNSTATAAAAASAAHGLSRALLRRVHAAAIAAEAAAVSLQDGICRKEIFEKEILPAILRTYYAESFPLLAGCYLTVRAVYASHQQDEQKTRNQARAMTGGTNRDPSAGMSSVALLKQYSACRDARDTAAAAALGTASRGNASAASSSAVIAEKQQQIVQRMLPRFNSKATCVEELFCLNDVVPLQLLNDGSMHTGTAASPLLQLLQEQQQHTEEQQQQAAAWGPFVIAAAKHAALQRRVGADHHLSKQLDLPQLARLLKILKFLCVLLKKQRRTFANQKDLEKQLRVGEEGPGAAVTAWLQSEYLLKNENDKYSMPKAYQTKVLATILWSCCALSADFKFDFSSLLETEFNNEKTANFAACASLIGMKPSRGNKNEYQLCFPSPLASLEEASDLSKAVQSVLQEKKRR